MPARYYPRTGLITVCGQACLESYRIRFRLVWVVEVALDLATLHFLELFLCSFLCPFGFVNSLSRFRIPRRSPSKKLVKKKSKKTRKIKDYIMSFVMKKTLKKGCFEERLGFSSNTHSEVLLQDCGRSYSSMH